MMRTNVKSFRTVCDAKRRAFGWRLLRSTLVVAVALWSSAASAQGAAPFLPGAAGAGDAYFPLDGNGGYDVKHYDLALQYDPATDQLEGRAKIRAKATQNLSSFNLDLVGLIVHSVTVDGRPTPFARDGGELTITPDGGLRQSRTFTVVVDYSGIPQSLEGAGFLHTDDGTLVAGEPHVAASWFPVNDHPTDKASYRFAITVPEGRTAVANGILLRQQTAGGWATWTWDAREPMASYLTTATIGQFDLRAYKKNGVRFWDAVDPDLLAAPFAPLIEQNFALQPEIIAFFEDRLASYPFRAGGAIVDDFRGLGFALENQSRPIYAVEWFSDYPDEVESTFVHEIAHQWFGDSLTIASWRDIWLNEGFAAYTEWLWDEAKHGVPAQENFDRHYFARGENNPFWQVIVGDPGPDRIFDSAIYERGAMTLHQLRLAVGDSAFFTILKRWTTQRKGDNVTIEEFIALAERVSGQDLSDLFTTWLFTPGRPVLAQPLAAAASVSTASDLAAETLIPSHAGLRR
jgi:aminopeptidase N